MSDPHSKPPVSLEDLLRFKRAERPSAEFWTGFDHELREKQLAALVEKQPWWRSLPRSLGTMARYHLPLGATAVLAVTLLTIRDYQPAASAPNGTPASATAKPTEEVTGADLYDQQVVAAVAPAEADQPVAVAAAADADRRTAAPTATRLSPMVTLLSSIDASSALHDMRPSTRSIEENRVVAERLLGMHSDGFEARALPVRTAPQEPLAQMSSPAETRRSRFAVAFANANISPAPTARVARRLSDEQLYDSIRRFGASGNTVSIKF